MYGELGNKKYKEYARDINGSGEHLLSLIDDILDTSRLELDTIKPQFEYFSFDKIIEECVILVDKKSIEKQVTINADIEKNIDDVFLDPKLCKQIIINLLSNAAKFSLNDDQIHIRLISNLDTIEITVEDKGIGIEEEDLNSIFEPFMQANASYTLAYEGVGLGLTIVKRLTEIQNGRVSVTSKQGIGTCFKVILPMNAENE